MNMGISTNSKIAISGASNETSFNTNSNSIVAKTKSDDNIRDTFQNIMGLVNVNQNQSSDYSSKSERTQSALSDISSSGSKSSSDSTSVYKRESQQYKENKVKGSDDSSKAEDKSLKTNDADDVSGKSSAYTKASKNSSGKDTAKETEITDDLSQSASQIIESIARIMDVSVDQIQQSMDELGMDVSDLLTDEGVKQLVLNIQGADNIDMLVDESLGQYMSDISDSIENILTETQNIDNAVPANEVDVNTDLTEKNGRSEKIMENQEKININNKASDTDNTAVEETADESENSSLTDIIEASTNSEDTSEFNESAAQGDTSPSQNQNQQGDALDNNLINNLANALTDAVSQSGEVSEFDGDIEAADIVRQVVDEIKANVNDKVRSLEIRLNPENLGRVQISVTTKNGVMQAKIIAENEAAKNAIEGSISLLKETFNEQNLKVEAVEVTIANYEFFKEDNETQNDENKQKNTSSGGNDSKGNDDIVKEELSDAEQLEKDMMQQTGNSVSYTV